MHQPSSSVRRGPLRRFAALLAALLLLGAGSARVAPAQGVCAPARSGSAAAQGPDSSGADTTAEAAAGSPRAALEQFFALARAGRYADAAAYLDQRETDPAARADAARRLKAVLDRDLWIDLDRVSPSPAGDTSDDLPSGVEQLGTIKRPSGAAVPVRMTRTPRDPEISWRFSRRTVTQLDALYDSLGDRWMLEHLPETLLRPGPFEILRWQWLALPLLLAAAALVAALLARLAQAIVVRVVARTHTHWDDAVVERLHTPFTAALTIAIAWALLPLLDLYAPAYAGVQRVARVALFVVFFWSLWRLVDVVRDVLGTTRWGLASPSSRALLPLAARSTKVVVIAVAAVSVLSVLGYPVGSLLAGLGIGGLAVALAAQKTVENLFGAFSIGVDQPFREGDFVKVDDFVGTVERIGLRSTRFRTLDRTLVTLPNGKLADMRLESFAVRDRLRFAAVIGLVYETTPAQMREVLAGFERVLRDEPKLWPDALTVRFSAFSASSLDIEVMAWFRTSDWSEFQLIRQEILLRFMEVVERAGTSIAFPTRTVHLGEEAVEALRGAVRGSREGDGNGSAVEAQRPEQRSH
jgi:MscS family membrane protein